MDGLLDTHATDDLQSMKSDFLRPDLLEAQSTGSMKGNLLAVDDDFQDQIKNLDRMFDADGLSMLKSDRSEKFERTK